MTRPLAVLSLLLLAGCAAVKPADKPTMLRAAPVFGPASAATGRTLALAPVSAHGAAADRRYAYVEAGAPGEVRQAASLFWEEAPPKLLERALVGGLSTLLGPIAGPDVAIAADRRLVVRLDRFEEAGSGADARAAVAFEASLIGADRKLALSGRYCAYAPISGSSGSARAGAFEAALRDVAVRLGRDIVSGSAASGGC